MKPSKAFELQHKALGLLRNSQYWLEKGRLEEANADLEKAEALLNELRHAD